MNQELRDYLEQQEEEMRRAKLDALESQNNSYQQAMSIQEQEKSMIKDQLDLVDELEMIENLLRGNVLRKNTQNGLMEWKAPEDPEMIILSEHGVHLIMNTITFYLNKNTLLSNYEDKVIDAKMEDFSVALADVVFMEYEKVFKYPTLEECKDVLMSRINKKVELRKFAKELIGETIDEETEREKIVREIEDRIYNELTKIKEQIIKNKLKRFEILIREVQDSVHSTYLRAWKGQERTTLRQHIHVTENRGQPKIPYANPSKRSPLSFLRMR